MGVVVTEYLTTPALGAYLFRNDAHPLFLYGIGLTAVCR